MDIFESMTFRLLRLAARFRPEPSSNRRRVTPEEVAELVDRMMGEGLYAEEFAYLDDPKPSYFQMLPIMEKFLKRLNWQPLDDEGEFRFMTALYATIGRTDDVSAYHAICRWMEDVGRQLDGGFSVKTVGDGIGAERIYGCYYSYSNVTGEDLIPSIRDPAVHDWKMEGEARPKTVFAEWLDRHPKDFDNYRPFNEELLSSLTA